MADNIKKMKQIPLPKMNAGKTSSKYDSTSVSQIEGYVDEELHFERLSSSGNVGDYTIINATIDDSRWVPARLGRILRSLQNDDFNYSLSDVADYGLNSSGQVVIRMQSGESLLFSKEDDSLVSIGLSDGTEIHCTLSDAEEAQLSRMVEGVSITDQIKGYVDVDVNGYKTRVYWMNDSKTGLTEFKNHLDSINYAIDRIPGPILNECMRGNGGEFKGFFVGPTDLPICAVTPDEGNYIYIKVDSNNSYRTIVHELGHVFDSSIGGDHHVSDTSHWINNFYEEYGEVMSSLAPTNSIYHTKGIPNVHEFFACIFEAYIDTPHDLEELIPEVYYKLNRWFKSFGA